MNQKNLVNRNFGDEVKKLLMTAASLTSSFQLRRLVFTRPSSLPETFLDAISRCKWKDLLPNHLHICVASPGSLCVRAVSDDGNIILVRVWQSSEKWASTPNRHFFPRQPPANWFQGHRLRSLTQRMFSRQCEVYILGPLASLSQNIKLCANQACRIDLDASTLRVQLYTQGVLPRYISHWSSSSCCVSTGAAAGGRLHRLPDWLAERLQPRAAAGPQAGGPRHQQEIHHAQSLWFSPPGWAGPLTRDLVCNCSLWSMQNTSAKTISPLSWQTAVVGFDY